MIKKYIPVLLQFLIAFSATADSHKTISHIGKISPVVKNADQDTLVIFDVDYVISTPTDLIGRPIGEEIYDIIFKEYEQKHGQERVRYLHSLYWIKAGEEFVEPNIKNIIKKLQKRNIPTIALTAVGTEKLGIIEDPMHLRTSRLKDKGIIFSFRNLHERILWSSNAGYESGIIFAGKQSKGQVLKHFLDNIAHWKPKHIIFIDDKLDNLNSVNAICDEMRIQFTGFHYKSAVFEQDRELSPEVAKLQIKTLDEEKIWIPDSQIYEKLETKE